MAVKYMRKGIGIVNCENRGLTPENCFKRITADGTNSIRLLPKWHITDAVKKRRSDGEKQRYQ